MSLSGKPLGKVPAGRDFLPVHVTLLLNSEEIGKLNKAVELDDREWFSVEFYMACRLKIALNSDVFFLPARTGNVPAPASGEPITENHR